MNLSPHEVADILSDKFNGSVLEMVRSAGDSALRLVDVVTNSFPCFRDCADYEGYRVSFLKRAQIFVADLWSAFGVRKFHDIDQLTMFADYRVPQSLQYLGVLQYSEVELIILHMR